MRSAPVAHFLSGDMRVVLRNHCVEHSDFERCFEHTFAFGCVGFRCFWCRNWGSHRKKRSFYRHFRPKAASRHAIGRCFADHRTGRSCIMQHLERLGRNRAVQNGNQAAIRQSIGEAASLVRREMCWIPALFQAVALSFVSDPREQGAMTAKGFALACFSHRSSC
jgi:hypothetical protein